MTATTAAALTKLAGRLSREGWLATYRHVRTVGRHHLLVSIEAGFHPEAGTGDATTDKVELSGLAVVGPHKSAGVHYLPTPWTVLDWVHAALPPPTPAWTFVDLGCGKGRAVLSASRRPYGRIIGVEFAAELADVARSAVARLPEEARDRIDIVEADACDFEHPATPLVVFLFNPFGPPVIHNVAQRLADAWRRHRRPIVVAYLNPAHVTAFARTTVFEKVRLRWQTDLRFRFLSPFALSILATPDARQLFVRGNCPHATGGHEM